ncbi:MAG: S8/S53 family peptidase, partial [Nonlabens sp.]|nr:S8/S53 family peptidase [Nonlabens sp.]
VDWTHAPTNVLYSAIHHGDGILSLGYGQDDEYFAVDKNDALVAARDNALAVVATKEGLEPKEVLITADPLFNVIDVKVANYETIAALQHTANIRYLDPIGYGDYIDPTVIAPKSSSGCDQSGQTINPADYTVIAPNAWRPWNYALHNIDDAWLQTTGAGVTVGLIDTGISVNQNLLGANFNDGYSTGRSIQKFGTFIDSNWYWATSTDGPNDRCGHGTTMGAAIASPRNNDFMPVGVAYNANLIAYRGTEDVLLNDYHERKGVSNALVQLGNNSQVKIISMSIGYVWSIGNVKDAVKYAYSKNKMIIAAGGTSTSLTSWYGVIFPASMSETVAVTGLKDNGYNRCDICHEGSEIDFTIVMQRAGDDSRTVPTLGFNSGSRKYVGGSSVATATTAGIAALVWSKNPTWSREQVLDKLKRSAQFYPSRNSKFGYGNIDALKAVN